jgi:multidrug efflux pump subunit AcrA (membrane-fusion protein)
VYVAANGKAQRRAIETGIEDGEHVEVRSGVKAGEMVITHGQTGLPDGAAISVGAPDKEKAAAPDEKPAAPAKKQ